MSTTSKKSPRGAKPLEPVPAVGPVLDQDRLEHRNQMLAEMSAVQSDLQHNAAKTARELGYEGEISIPTLEDGIRFYQRRTVEDLLELGKRLILLKELTPHGEFEERVDMLGIADRTARRFMGAAAKVSKSEKLSHLAGRAKNASALLELVTYDDDDLDSLADIDDVERMSPSQLRAALRESQRNYEAREQVIKHTQSEVQAAREKLAQLPRMRPDERMAAMGNEYVALMESARMAAANACAGLRSMMAYGDEADVEWDGQQVSHYTQRLVEPIAELMVTLSLAGAHGPVEALRATLNNAEG
jgi:hypothetical protein